MTQPIRVVFDCTVFAQALINPKGPAGSCLTAAQGGQVRLFVSDFVIREIHELPQKLPTRLCVTPERVHALILDLAKYTEPIDKVPEVFMYQRDPDDAHYVNLADAAKATFLVSRDKDLLDLAFDDDFKSRFPNLRILNPPQFHRELESIFSKGHS
jgi:putative PIN family toxin of toxin-antitoxin system